MLRTGTIEAGIRVPLIIRWPGKLPAGAECSQVSATFDLPRSFLELGGAKSPSEQLDGYDIIDHVVGRRDDFKRTLFWRGRRDERTWWAVRDGDAKYVRQSEGAQSDEWLFDLASDIGEQSDQLDNKPAETARLKGLLRDLETAVKHQR